MGCIIPGLTFFCTFWPPGGGPAPLSSPLLTNTLRGLPKHLMDERYFLALLPARSSNSLGVSHSSPSWIHFPLDPDSYLAVNITAVVDLHLTFIIGPILGLEALALAFTVLLLLPPLESLMPLCEVLWEDIIDGEFRVEASEGAGEGGGGPIVAKGLCCGVGGAVM